ncbi:MAG: hypothetical protein HY220_03785 [Candidatus Sungbacteria bacterium]|uniref:Uncharacterized protein n=1 Tax=Candidatus Sungiibacteriota bacterium TaxID=2750080 RepID=A0A9D6QU59_9BACT|nr:hypothetical protein [Candidatus Sungbacteria bacterium]
MANEVAPIEKLSQINFLSVCDVAMDILEQLQLSTEDKVTIKLIRNLIRFSILLPAKAPNLMDEYGDNRMRAVIYLEEIGVIAHYKVLSDYNHYEAEILIDLNRGSFNSFYDKLGEVYEKRVVEPAKKNESQGDTSRIKSSDFSYSKDDEVCFRGLKAKIPGNTNQSGICKFLFGQNLGSWFDWDTVYQEIKGAEPMKNESKVIADAVEAINQKTEQTIGLKIIEFKDKKLRLNPRLS